MKTPLDAAQKLPASDEGPEDARLAELQQLAAIGQTAASVVHEVRNVMTAVLGFAQVARTKLDAGSPALEPVKVIDVELRRCLGILSHFLRLSDPRRGEPQLVDLRDVVGDVVHLCGHQLALHGVEVDVTLGEPPPVRAIAGDLQQALLNLMLNAIQAMQPEGGRVRIVVDGDRASHGAFITVADTGPGIERALLQRIFEPFFSTKQPGKGTGLGLSVSRTLVEQHGGTLSATSEPGRGACFRIALPAAPVAAGREG